MLALIDAIGPFFRPGRQRRINWSKIPFRDLPAGGPDHEACWAAIRGDMREFAGRVRALGYTAITLDDVAHLTDLPDYEPAIRETIGVFAGEFRRIIADVRAAGLRVFVTADYLVTSPAVDASLRDHPGRCQEWFRRQVAVFLDAFPEVDGVILRVGESDGRDVKDTLRSRLVLRNAGQANRLLKSLLPEFESRGKKLIFRTWTVGAHLIGDLIWNRGRLASALDGIDSPAFILSMKHGESDFFRYLPINRQFFRYDGAKILELQARREYEGAGEYPSFIGWDLERQLAELQGVQNLVGFSVWCQTGGWHAFRRRAFLGPDGLWIELNAFVAARMILGRATVEEAVAGYFGAEKASAALELLRRADRAILEGLYIGEFASRKLFFRRVRIPPLIHVYWDSIFVNAATRSVLTHFTSDPEAAIRQGEAACGQFDAMETLARQCDLPVEDIHFMRDCFALMQLARRHALMPPDPALEAEILAAKKAYKEAWPRGPRQRYRIRVSFAPAGLSRPTISWIARLLIRSRRGYRPILDQLFTLRVLSWLVLFFHARHEKIMPKFLRKSAMGVDTVFR